MKCSFFYLSVLLVVAMQPDSHGKDEGAKRVVYDYVGKGSDRTDESVYRRVYGKKFRIVEVDDRRSYVEGKFTQQLPVDARDDTGKMLTGFVRVELILDQEGWVLEPFILRSSNELLNEPVLRAIRQWRGKPARLNGLPVARLAAQEFVFEQPPLPKFLRAFPDARAIDAKGRKHLLSDYPAFLKDVTKKVLPDYNRSTYRHDGEGEGLFRVNIDPQTGTVTDAWILKAAYSGSLDVRTLRALRQWRWKPGTWKQVDLYVVFGSPESSPGAHYGDSSFPRAVPHYPASIVP